uniref:Secreted protein n=1 Tax=Rhizophora mucronata TaxID=61149 RepID=A0A2P2NRM2_RHIMU
MRTSFLWQHLSCQVPFACCFWLHSSHQMGQAFHRIMTFSTYYLSGSFCIPENKLLIHSSNSNTLHFAVNYQCFIAKKNIC